MILLMLQDIAEDKRYSALHVLALGGAYFCVALVELAFYLFALPYIKLSRLHYAIYRRVSKMWMDTPRAHTIAKTGLTSEPEQEEK